MKTKALAMLIIFTHLAFAEPPCGDINCYFERKNRDTELEKRKQQQELDAYRAQQLQMQEEQLNAIQKQNDLIEGQNKLHLEEVDALKKLQAPPSEKLPGTPNTRQQQP